MTTTETKRRTITLTGRSPVTIREDLWPVIAHGTYSDHDNQYEFQANRTWKCDVRVRRHADGRAIVYGVYAYSSAFQNERDFIARAGELVATGADVVSAIHAVAETLCSIAEEQGREEFTAHVRKAERATIADLPAEDLD